MGEALRKASDYVAPMNLRFPSVRCVSLTEDQKRRRQLEHRWNDFDDRVRYSRSPLRYQMSGDIMYDDGHDELDYSSGQYGYDIEDGAYEAFGLEPQSIEIGSDISGDFVVVERGWVRMIAGYVL